MRSAFQVMLRIMPGSSYTTLFAGFFRSFTGKPGFPLICLFLLEVKKAFQLTSVNISKSSLDVSVPYLNLDLFCVRFHGIELSCGISNQV